MSNVPRVYLDEGYGFHYPPDARHGDGADEEVALVVHDHWLSYPPAHPFLQHFFGLLFFFLWFMSSCGNGIVVFIFLKMKSLRTPSNMLVVSLALSDFIMINTMAPPMFVNVFISRYWAFGARACEWYGFIGGVFGTASLWLIIMIGYDRYNVIVRGFNGVKITPGIAFLMILFSFGFSVACCLPPLLNVWGAYKLEGLLITCSFDYLTDTMNNKSFSAFFFGTCYILPMLAVIYFYGQIVGAVVAHERALKAQAKKMNVDSLRSNKDENADSAEVRIAKVAITNVMLWTIAWSPYAWICMIGQFGGSSLLTPIGTQLPSCFAKTASCFNPVIYAISHPKFREALSKEMPCFGIHEKAAVEKSENQTVAESAT